MPLSRAAFDGLGVRCEWRDDRRDEPASLAGGRGGGDKSWNAGPGDEKSSSRFKRR